MVPQRLNPVFLTARFANSSSQGDSSVVGNQNNPGYLEEVLRRRHVVLFGARPLVLSVKEVLKQLQKFQIKDQEFRGSIFI